MAKVLSLEVVTPEKVVLEEETTSIVVPATEGYFGGFTQSRTTYYRFAAGGNSISSG